MNSKRYRNKRYKIREITDIKDMLYSSTSLYSDSNAFLIKETPGGDFKPVRYSQFKDDVDGLGTALKELGLTGKKIAVIGENRYEWVLTYFAVCCGVGIIVPVERELPPSEIKNLLKQVDVSAVVYSRKMEESMKETFEDLEGLEQIISMDAATHESNKLSLKQLVFEGKERIKAGDRGFIDRLIDPEAMGMLLFTSGTTGAAKGVKLSHKNIVANVMNMSMYVNVEGCTGLSVLPMHHTYEMTCHIMTALYQGCCVAICEGLRHIVKNMVEARANVMLGVPLLFEAMHKKIWKQAEKSGKAKKMRRAIALSKTFHLYNTGIAKKMFKEIHDTLGGGMQLLISGAAGIDPKVVEDFCAMGITMIQGYGMTENSPIIAVNMDRYSKPSSVGLAMPNTDIRIIDADENGIGEVICKGDSVMLGYYDNEEETARVLKDGWLYTGDYGYFDQDHFLYLTGRKKNVIVTKNGKNIFPEEVEFFLSRNNYIAEVVVYGKVEEKSGENIVCAEIYPDHEIIEESLGKLSEFELEELLKEVIDQANDQMPVYMRVKRFHIRDSEFEKTPSQKIIRHLADYNKTPEYEQWGFA
ncbi:MAG: AMP-binding protein [Eubacteriales bacterium]|nr:AMP-binding protein [Eubacteriales bacterium]MDD4583042.1 AMP-binding protein [Eubacteriales bacterium]